MWWPLISSSAVNVSAVCSHRTKDIHKGQLWHHGLSMACKIWDRGMVSFSAVPCSTLWKRPSWIWPLLQLSLNPISCWTWPILVPELVRSWELVSIGKDHRRGSLPRHHVHCCGPLQGAQSTFNSCTAAGRLCHDGALFCIQFGEQFLLPKGAGKTSKSLFDFSTGCFNIYRQYPWWWFLSLLCSVYLIATVCHFWL